MSGVWKSGPPPSLGWWPASVCQNKDAIRWWDGERWSTAAYRGMRGYGEVANLKVNGFSGVEWTDRPKSWPAQSFT